MACGHKIVSCCRHYELTWTGIWGVRLYHRRCFSRRHQVLHTSIPRFKALSFRGIKECLLAGRTFLRAVKTEFNSTIPVFLRKAPSITMFEMRMSPSFSAMSLASISIRMMSERMDGAWTSEVLRKSLPPFMIRGSNFLNEASLRMSIVEGFRTIGEP